MFQKHSLSLLNFADPIFDSLRETYPGFDLWVARVSQEPVDERYAFSASNSSRLQAVAIVKQHEAPSVSKLCTFKVSPSAAGGGVGSTLLASVIEEVKNSGSSAVVVDFFPSQLQLREFFNHKGFVQVGETSSGEVRYKLKV